MRKTLLMEAVEIAVGEPIEHFLKQRMRAGWTHADIVDDIADKTGIPVSQPTISTWTRGMNLSIRQSSQQAWRHDLIPDPVLEERVQGIRLYGSESAKSRRRRTR